MLTCHNPILGAAQPQYEYQKPFILDRHRSAPILPAIMMSKKESPRTTVLSCAGLPSICLWLGWGTGIPNRVSMRDPGGGAQN